MEITLRASPKAQEHNPHATLSTGLAWGLIGGLAGTLSMDLILIAALSAAGLPAFTCFSIVGDTAAQFFSLLGIEIAGGILAGVAAHYMIGPMIGAIFGAVVSRVHALRADTLKKGILFGVLYVEILSQPILATAPILLKMSAADTLKWYGGSFVMHLIAGIVLGAVVSCGLRLSTAADYK